MAGVSSYIAETLCPASKEKAKVELNENEEDIPSAILALREACKKHAAENKDFVFCVDDCSDNFVGMFLRARKYNLERALALLLNYVKFRKNHSEYYEGVTLDMVREVALATLPMVFKGRDAEGRRVIAFRPRLLDPAKFPMKKVFPTTLYILDALIQDPETQVNGIVLIEDWTGMTMWKAMMFENKEVKMFIDLFQDCFPARLKAINLYNHPWFFSIVWAVAKPFMKEKMKARFKLHGHSLSSLHEVVPADVLCDEYGGSFSYSAQELVDFLENTKVERPPVGTTAEGTAV